MARAKRDPVAEAEDIGKGLPDHTQADVGKSPDLVKPAAEAPDYVWAEYVQAMHPDLVLGKYFAAYIRHKKDEKGWATLTDVGAQKSITATKQTVHVQFKRIAQAIAEAKAAPAAERTLESLTAKRVAEILQRGMPVQLDPYSLLRGHPDLKYFQRRRVRAQHDLAELAESIGDWGILEMITVQAPCEENGRIRRIIDGYGRAEAWTIADRKAGGTPETPVLEYPVCFVVECTNREAALIVLEKNRHRENFDDADRDYALVLMNENEDYSVTDLARIQGLDKSTVSLILSAWQDVPQELRSCLESRKVTTSHGRQIARLKKWPREQERLTKWVIEQVDMMNWDDAHFRNLGDPLLYDADGVSAGQLGMMVNSSIERLTNAQKAAAKLEEMKQKGTVSEKIDEEQAEKLRAKLAKDLGKRELSKTSMQMALKEAGVKVQKPASDEYHDGPKKPASPAKYREDAPAKPIPPCMNCTLYYAAKEQCEWSLKPNAENKCPVQAGFMGRPTQYLHVCGLCGGPTPDSHMKRNNIAVQTSFDGESETIDHNICVIDRLISNNRLSGMCSQCQVENCQVLQMLDEQEGIEGLRLQVLGCPTGYVGGYDWFDQRPAIPISELNAKVQAELDDLKGRMLDDKPRPARSVEQVRAEFEPQLVLVGHPYTLAGVYESEEEANKRVEQCYADSEDHDLQIRGGFGDPKLWGVYVRPLEQDEPDEGSEEDAAEEDA